jgi:hypothetical protein
MSEGKKLEPAFDHQKIQMSQIYNHPESSLASELIAILVSQFVSVITFGGL